MATITFSCHKCGQVLRAGSAAAGKKAKCPKCATIVPIPAAEAEEPELVIEKSAVKAGKPRPGPPPLPPTSLLRDEEDDADEPQPRKRRRDDEEESGARTQTDEEDAEELDRPKGMSKKARWAKVRLGLLLTFIGACVLVGYGAISVLGSIMTYVAFLARPSPGLSDVAGVFSKIGVALSFLLQFPVIVGYGFTLVTPNKRKALALAIACLAMGVVNLGLKALALIAMFRMEGPALAGLPGIPNMGSLAAVIIVMILVLLVLGSEWILYPLFLRAAALNLKDRALAGTALLPMFFACGVVALQVLNVILAISIFSAGFNMRSEAMVHVILILSIITNAVLVAFAVMYTRAQSQVRAAI